MHQELLSLLDGLQETFILVEGPSDKAALQELGLYSVVAIDKRPHYKVVESLLQADIKEIVILTDLDTEGRKLYRKFNHECSQRGIKVNNKLRHFLLRETSLGQVEGLAKFIRNLERKETQGITSSQMKRIREEEK